MSTDYPLAFDQPGEATYERPPLFQGGEFATQEGFDTIRQAREYVNSLTQGYADPFLADAWKRIDVIRRRVGGKYATNPAWIVSVTYQRPRPGDYSGGGYPNDPMQVLETE